MVGISTGLQVKLKLEEPMRTLFTRAFVISISLLASTASAITPQAETYLDVALNIMCKNVYGTEKVDWDKLRIKSYETAKNASIPSETYPAIREALETVDPRGWLDENPSNGAGESETRLGLGLNWTVYQNQRVVSRIYPESASAIAGVRVGDMILEVDGQAVALDQDLYANGTTKLTLTLRRVGTTDPIELEVILKPLGPDNLPVSVKRLENRIGFLDIPTTTDKDDSATGSGFAVRAHEAIRQISREPLCGWVVDARRNWDGLSEGLATVAAVLGEGVLGGFTGPTFTDKITFQKGELQVNGKSILAVSPAKQMCQSRC